MQRRKRRLTIFLAPVNDLTPCATTPPSRGKRTRARDRIERESSLVAVERRAEHRIHGKGAAARALCAGAGRGTDGGRGAAPCRKELLSPLSTLYIARAELEASPPTRCFTPRHVCTLPYEYGFTGAPEPPVKVISIHSFTHRESRRYGTHRLSHTAWVRYQRCAKGAHLNVRANENNALRFL